MAKGAPLTLSGREDIWDGHRWLWAIGDDGRAGWVPDDLLVTVDGRPVAAWDYTAIELTVAAGERVDLLHHTHGWGWCRDGDGREGWLPLGKLAEV